MIPKRIEDAIAVQGFLRATPAERADWLRDTSRWGRSRGLLRLCVGVVVVGAGAYGAVMGAWREPLQALFTGIKLPLLVLMTTAGNALLNAMLAPLLGLNLTLRECAGAVLMTFAIAAALLGSVTPVAAFVVWNSPPLSAATALRSVEYGFLQVGHVGCIAVAGVVGNAVLYPSLLAISGSRSIARRTLVAWLTVNLLLGSQLCWVLRPFIWDPARPVEFIGPEYFRGSFYETVFDAARQLLAQWLS